MIVLRPPTVLHLDPTGYIVPVVSPPYKSSVNNRGIIPQSSKTDLIPIFKLVM